MIKGAQKQLIVLRTANSPYFDEAYFVLRHSTHPKKQNRTDILSEANRILEENALELPPTVKKSRRAWLWFLGGFFCGGGGCFLLLTLLL
ncbi:MAG: hypothetical protein IJX28_01010 [Clostridia bacterium]|nr:hypothetical protein [Clostridia bacterium]